MKHMVPPARGMSSIKNWVPTIQVAQHWSIIKKKKKKKRTKYNAGVGTVATCQMPRDWQRSFWNGMVVPTWWVSAWFIHPPKWSDCGHSLYTSTYFNVWLCCTILQVAKFDFVVQYCKLQRYMIPVRFPSKILEIYLVRSMIDCEFVMIRGSFGRPFRSNQSRGGIDFKWIQLLTRSLNLRQKKDLFMFVCLFVKKIS